MTSDLENPAYGRLLADGSLALYLATGRRQWRERQMSDLVLPIKSQS